MRNEKMRSNRDDYEWPITAIWRSSRAILRCCFEGMTGPFQAAQPTVERFALPFQPGVQYREPVRKLSTTAMQRCNHTAPDDPSAGSRHGEAPC